jgi:hypothetical protein
MINVNANIIGINQIEAGQVGPPQPPATNLALQWCPSDNLGGAIGGYSYINYNIGSVSTYGNVSYNFSLSNFVEITNIQGQFGGGINVNGGLITGSYSIAAVAIPKSDTNDLGQAVFSNGMSKRRFGVTPAADYPFTSNTWLLANINSPTKGNAFVLNSNFSSSVFYSDEFFPSPYQQFVVSASLPGVTGSFELKKDEVNIWGYTYDYPNNEVRFYRMEEGYIVNVSDPFPASYLGIVDNTVPGDTDKFREAGGGWQIGYLSSSVGNDPITAGPVPAGPLSGSFVGSVKGILLYSDLLEPQEMAQALYYLQYPFPLSGSI